MFCAELYRIGLKAELRRLICGGKNSSSTDLGKLMARFVSPIETVAAERFWSCWLLRIIGCVTCHEIPP